MPRLQARRGRAARHAERAATPGPVRLKCGRLTVRSRLGLSFSVPPALAAHGRLPEWPKGAVCKTVGSAYVGSNPTPATRFRRSEPVTRDCVTGFYVQSERFRRPLALVCGPCVGQIRRSAAAGRERGVARVSCGNSQRAGRL